MPEGATRFPAGDPRFPHLLVAQAHIPPTELVEVAGFTGTRGTIGPRFDAFDDGLGTAVPSPDASTFRNDPIRQVVLDKLNGTPGYRTKFGQVFPSVAGGGPIDFAMFGRAIAEFEFTLVQANAPVDRFERGESNAMLNSEKRGALLFFGKAECVSCHKVGGQSNEMFSDFENHVAGVPQVAPRFGVGKGNVIFDGPGEDEDFGLEQLTGDAADRYKFRTAPLRNAAAAPSFIHNGAFTRLKDAVRFHVNTLDAARQYNPNAAGLDSDLTHRLGPIEPVLARLDPRLANPPQLSEGEIEDLVKFVGDSLLDPGASKKSLCSLIPAAVPSGIPVLRFQGCPDR
ncbi:MAG TPA: cytochrome c peroxidase [Paludibaculum sp.]|jgi:cytochrome c peroxidase